jgi:hypothetical protein
MPSITDGVRKVRAQAPSICATMASDWCQQAPVIEPIYPFQSSEFQSLEAAPRPVAVNDLGFVKRVHGLGECNDKTVKVRNRQAPMKSHLARCRGNLIVDK